MLTLSVALVVSSLATAQGTTEADTTAPRPVEVLRGEAERVLATVECKGTKSFLAATSALPDVGERTVLRDPKTRAAVTAEEHARLPPEEQARFQPTAYGAEFYYTTGYGSPLAYARALDVVGKLAGTTESDALSGKRVLDFGYGGIGHLRLLASLGCDAVGVDVDPLLHAYYRAEDQGTIANAAAGGAAGRLTLVHGRWPADAAVKDAVGGGYDLVLSKNTLKKGYVRPAEKADPRMLIQLGVPTEQFLPEVARILKPGGIFAIYNICPGQPDGRYLPMADGRSPFTREEFEAAGFDVLAFEVVDDAAIRELAYALTWDEQGMDVERDTFAWYTVARRRGP